MVVISSVPGFSRALQLQRLIQQLDGVHDARAIGYERGALSLEIEHEGALQLRDALLALPNVQLNLVSEEDGSLELAYETQ